MSKVNYCNDVLQELDIVDLVKLRNLYKDRSDDTIHVYNYLSTVLKWCTIKPSEHYFTILVSKEEDWMSTGTFLGRNQFHCNEIIMCTLEESGESLRKAILKTKRINWSEPMMLYAITGKLYPIVMEALKSTFFEHCLTDVCDVWWAPKEEATNFTVNCPEDVYISELKPIHAKAVNEVWGFRYVGSERYIATIIEMNGGYGVFLKDSNELVAWTLYNTMGLGAIGTDPKHRCKGYGELITKYMSGKIAESGYHPMVNINSENKASQKVFTKNRFKIACKVFFVLNKQLVHIQNLAKL